MRRQSPAISGRTTGVSITVISPWKLAMARAISARWPSLNWMVESSLLIMRASGQALCWCRWVPFSRACCSQDLHHAFTVDVYGGGAWRWQALGFEGCAGFCCAAHHGGKGLDAGFGSLDCVHGVAPRLVIPISQPHQRARLPQGCVLGWLLMGTG